MADPLSVETPTSRKSWPVEKLTKLASARELRMSEVVPEDPTATHVSFISSIDDYRASIPLDVVRRQGILTIEDDDSVSLRVEDGWTRCWHVKDLGVIRLTVGAEPDSVPEEPTH